MIPKFKEVFDTMKLQELEQKITQFCEETDTDIKGINTLIRYYSSLGWTKEDAYLHIINLFESGVIEQIKVLGFSKNN